MEALDLSALPADVLEAGAAIAEDSGLLAVADAALEATGSAGVAAQIVGDVADVLVDWEATPLPPVLSEWLEAHDDEIVEWTVSLVVRVMMDPDRRADRQIRRADRREHLHTWWNERKERRAGRRAARQED